MPPKKREPVMLRREEAMAAAAAKGLTPAFPGDVPGGKAVCICDHRGDGSASEHAGLLGHGSCKLCHCLKFTWRRFIWEVPPQPNATRITNEGKRR